MVNHSVNRLSVKEARKLAILSQGINRPSLFGAGLQGSLNALEHLGYVQIDTISVVERAHLHTFWSRNKSFSQKHLNALQLRGEMFEYWSHAAAFLPMRDYRFSLPRKKAYQAGDRHWHAKDPKVAKRVIDRITAEGPLQARDFDEERTHQHAWGGIKPAKIALERLFMEGELMISKREGFQKVYDLTERVLPANVNTTEPKETELCRHLVQRYLDAHGFGSSAEIAYLRKGLKPKVERVCQQMLEDGELVSIQIKQAMFYAQASALDRLSSPLSRTKLAILSPFDNLVIQRKRINHLFDFDYLIECYVPEAKRKYGYFCLPLLWGQELAGRIDVKIDRKTQVLHVRHLSVETPRLADFIDALKPSLNEFMRFNGGREIEVHRVSSSVPELSQKDLDALRLLLI